ncbi:hypothetical protein GQ53DRAFT_788574 [Thozetella sp. PMI_491]|nr:hypothetical protein GQ53DRAFT_788574 [Thozetella sp. PMI_491]
MNAFSPRSQKRTASTCLTCRARKVRCDGRPRLCTNCERLGFPCSYDDGGSSDDQALDDADHASDSNLGGGSGVWVPRRRVRQACLRCHAKKAKCTGTLPKCDRCQAQSLECIYRPGKRSLAASDATRGSEQRAASHDAAHAMPHAAFDRTAVAAANVANIGSPVQIAPALSPQNQVAEEGYDALAQRAFDAYFRHIHHIPVFAFLHRASVMQRYHAGQLDQALVLALIGIASLLADSGTTAEYGNRCIDDAAALVLGELEKPSVLRLQALVIIVKHRILSRRFASAFMLHATACRFATALRLNYENPNLSFLARESRRRLMWSLYMIDASIADGQADLAIWVDAESQIHLQLPCNERNFEFDLPETTEAVRPPRPEMGGTLVPLPDDFGFLALNVRIQWLRCRILQYTVKVLCSPPTEATALPSRCAQLATELQEFEARLPLSFRWSESNVRLRTYSPRLCVFVMTHVIWQQCHLDLYRLFLPGLKEGLPAAALGRLDPQFVVEGRNRCYEHARSLADMFAQLLAPGNSIPVTDLDLPSSAYQCARILDHGQRYHGEELGISPENVREVARVCKQISSRCESVPACAAIVSDIDKLIHGEGAIDSGRLGSPATGIPALDQPYPPTESLEGGRTSSLPLTPRSALGAGAIARTVGIDEAMSLIAAPLAPEHISVAESPAEHDMVAGASRNNAFDGALEGINFGPDSFDMDWSTALSDDWFGIGAYRSGMGGSA